MQKKICRFVDFFSSYLLPSNVNLTIYCSFVNFFVSYNFGEPKYKLQNTVAL